MSRVSIQLSFVLLPSSSINTAILIVKLIFPKTLQILKKVTEVISPCIDNNVTSRDILIWEVGDWIKAKLSYYFSSYFPCTKT